MVTRATKVWAKIKFRLLNISVEPIIFLVSAGWVFGNTIQAPAIYNKICNIYYGDNEFIDCRNLDDQHAEDVVQQHTALWNLFQVLAYLIPAIVADTILGAYADKKGRKTNILLGIFGITLVEFGFLLTLSYVNTPYWSTLIFSGVAGMTGYIAMIPVSCNAYLADTSSDSNELTIRSGIFSSSQILASAVGAFVAAAVSTKITVPVAIDVELGLFLLAFLYTLWRIPQKPGLLELDKKFMRKAGVSPMGVVPKKRNTTLKEKLKHFMIDMGELLCSGFHVYTKKREGHRRLFMFISIFVLILSLTTSAETRTSGIITSFVFRRTDEGSLDWDSTDLGLWNGSGYLISLIGTLGGVYVLKYQMKLRETSLILIGLFSSCLRTLLIASSVNSWMMYVANVFGMFSGLVQPAVVSFVVQLIPQEEIGRIFSLFGIATDVAFILSTVIYSNIYRATVHWSAGFLFYMIAAVEVVAFLAMLWVHLKAKHEDVDCLETDGRRPTNVQTAISRIGEIAPPMENGSLKKKDTLNKKLGKRQISIIEHAEALNNNRPQPALWESTEDLRSNRMSNTNFY